MPVEKRQVITSENHVYTSPDNFLVNCRERAIFEQFSTVKLPMIETRTGDVLRLSASGSVIDTVKTDPRLVPSHSVGMSVDGSADIYSNERKKRE
jgi:hypothetical protein